MKILYISPNPSDALSFYRGAQPLRRLRQHHQVEYVQTDSLNWSTIVNCDLVFFQRPYTQEHKAVIDLCRKWKVPFVVDFDDWLYELSPDNPAFHTYNNNKEYYHHAAESAAAVMVATQDMADLYLDQHGIECEVVPNAYDDELLTPRPINDHFKIVLWRGSNSHTQDLLSVRQGYLNLIKKHTDWQFVFINVPPWWLGENFENVKTVAPRSTIDYMAMIQQMKPAIMTHPLMDCNFNRAKSMCSWIEASHAGAAFVGPNFKEYQREGIETYEPGDSKSFFDSVDGLITEPTRILENAAKGQAAITGSLSLREVNKKRFEIFKQFSS